jgi:uncharacterized protein YceH (UPF0502 family)
MRTPEVTREFRDKCNELAQLSDIPQVKLRLLRLAARYDQYLKEIDTGKSHLIVPDSDASNDADEGADTQGQG